MIFSETPLFMLFVPVPLRLMFRRILYLVDPSKLIQFYEEFYSSECQVTDGCTLRKQNDPVYILMAINLIFQSGLFYFQSQKDVCFALVWHCINESAFKESLGYTR